MAGQGQYSDGGVHLSQKDPVEATARGRIPEWTQPLVCSSLPVSVQTDRKWLLSLNKIGYPCLPPFCFTKVSFTPLILHIHARNGYMFLPSWLLCFYMVTYSTHLLLLGGGAPHPHIRNCALGPVLSAFTAVSARVTPLTSAELVQIYPRATDQN